MEICSTIIERETRDSNPHDLWSRLFSRQLPLPRIFRLSLPMFSSGRQGIRTLMTLRSRGLAGRPGKPYPATFPFTEVGQLRPGFLVIEMGVEPTKSPRSERDRFACLRTRSLQLDLPDWISGQNYCRLRNRTEPSNLMRVS